MPLFNVRLGVSISNQEDADRDLPILLQTPAAVRFVSYEPALAPVDFGAHLSCNRLGCAGKGGDHIGLDWVIVGAESGPSARPAHPDSFRSARDQCQVAGVPFFMKQMGSFWARRENADPERWETVDSKGGDPSEWPEDLRVRESPEGRA